jgi:hypothetical protein
VLNALRRPGANKKPLALRHASEFFTVPGIQQSQHRNLSKKKQPHESCDQLADLVANEKTVRFAASPMYLGSERLTFQNYTECTSCRKNLQYGASRFPSLYVTG